MTMANATRKQSEISMPREVPRYNSCDRKLMAVPWWFSKGIIIPKIDRRSRRLSIIIPITAGMPAKSVRANTIYLTSKPPMSNHALDLPMRISSHRAEKGRRRHDFADKDIELGNIVLGKIHYVIRHKQHIGFATLKNRIYVNFIQHWI